MGMRGGYTVGIGSGVSVAASALPVTIAMLATFAAFTVFAFTVSRRDIVPWSLLRVVGCPRVVPMIRVGDKRWAGLGPRPIHLGSLIAVLLHICGKIWVRIPMHIHVPAPVARTLVPSSIAVTGGSVMASSTLALASTPRDTGTGARTRVGSRRRPGTYTRFESIRTGFRLEVTSNARIQHRLPPAPPVFPLLFSVRTVRGRDRRSVHRG